MDYKKTGNLYIIPTPIGEIDNSSINKIAPETYDVIQSLSYFIVENIKISRRYLRRLNPDFDIDNSFFFILNKHTKHSEIATFLEPCLNNNNVGILSDAGYPAIADPGNKIVNLAHELNIEIFPLIGPSSILMALVSSGFCGQHFTFHGYLPKERKDRIKKIKFLSDKNLKGTQIFMETPFRNNNLISDILENCHDETQLCIASNISSANQKIKSQSIKLWKKTSYNFNKSPTIFIFAQ